MDDLEKYAENDIYTGLQSLGIGLTNILHTVARSTTKKYEFHYRIPTSSELLFELDMGFLVSILFQLKIVTNIQTQPGNKILVNISEEGSPNEVMVEIKKKKDIIIFSKHERN